MANKRNKDQGEPVPSYLKQDGYLYVMLTDADGRRQEHACLLYTSARWPSVRGSLGGGRTAPISTC